MRRSLALGFVLAIAAALAVPTTPADAGIRCGRHSHLVPAHWEGHGRHRHWVRAHCS
jgi:hypothetical protein